MSSNQRSRSMRLDFVLLIVFEFAIINITSSYEETCVNVKNHTVCYMNSGEAEIDWDSAWQLCNSRNSTLPVIRNRIEQDVFAKFLTEHATGSVVWTSGRNFTYDDWTWVDGRRYSGRDADFLSRRSERYQPVLDYDLRVRDVEKPHYPLHYICQYSRAMCDHVNGTLNVTSGCIRYSDDERSWYDARNQCLMTGGDLAVVNVSDRRISKHFRYSWIGLRKTSWRWNLNKYASEEDEIKYTNWADDWDPLTGDCVSINASNGKWKAIECSRKLKVVCQRDFVNRTSSKFNTCEALLSASLERESQTVSYATFISVVMIGICVIIISNIIIAIAVRKYVLRRSSHVASSIETTENMRYQDLETIQKQAKPDCIYTGLQLQPCYEEVRRREN